MCKTILRGSILHDTHHGKKYFESILPMIAINVRGTSIQDSLSDVCMFMKELFCHEKTKGDGGLDYSVNECLEVSIICSSSKYFLICGSGRIFVNLSKRFPRTVPLDSNSEWSIEQISDIGDKFDRQIREMVSMWEQVNDKILEINNKSFANLVVQIDILNVDDDVLGCIAKYCRSQKNELEGLPKNWIDDICNLVERFNRVQTYNSHDGLRFLMRVIVDNSKIYTVC